MSYNKRSPRAKRILGVCLNILFLFAAVACDPSLSSGGQPADDVIRVDPAGLDAQAATVTQIIDGDTIDVSQDGQEYRLRYIGMDTPERDEPFYREATAANESLVAGQTILLVKDVSETDRYGRLLRYVYLTDGTFVNAELVRLGFAQIATFPPDVRHQALFQQLQQEAREAGRGLWASP